MKAILFGPESLMWSHKYTKPDTMGMKWGIKSLNDLPISAIAVIAVDVCLIFIDNAFDSSADTGCFPHFQQCRVCPRIQKNLLRNQLSSSISIL